MSRSLSNPKASPEHRDHDTHEFPPQGGSTAAPSLVRRYPQTLAMTLPDFFAQDLQLVDAALDRLLPAVSTPPSSIHEAMRYSVFAGGKRIRPVLCLEAARIFSSDVTAALYPACAIEFIHTYSLIHDDLPALDNDDLRRGKPTCHKKFGEAIAILAGDALLTLSFATIALTPASPDVRVRILAEVASSAGSVNGMVGGQVADLEAEGRKISAGQLRYIHERKTSALLCGSVRLGGMSANCTGALLEALTDFGYHVGLAFQVIDDILDVTQTSEKLGKSAGKDIAAQKATYPALIGLDKSRVEAKRLTKQAHDALKIFGKKAGALHALATYLLEREY